MFCISLTDVYNSTLHLKESMANKQKTRTTFKSCLRKITTYVRQRVIDLHKPPQFVPDAFNDYAGDVIV
jgi:hypothetical protein